MAPSLCATRAGPSAPSRGCCTRRRCVPRAPAQRTLRSRLSQTEGFGQHFPYPTPPADHRLSKRRRPRRPPFRAAGGAEPIARRLRGVGRGAPRVGHARGARRRVLSRAACHFRRPGAQAVPAPRPPRAPSGLDCAPLGCGARAWHPGKRGEAPATEPLTPPGARRYSAKIVAGGFAASISEARHLVVSEIASGGKAAVSEIASGGKAAVSEIASGGKAAVSEIASGGKAAVSEIASGGGGAGRGVLRRGAAAGAAAPEAARGRPGAARAAENSTAGGGGASPGSRRARARRDAAGRGSRGSVGAARAKQGDREAARAARAAPGGRAR
jgi:hypothetical protein